MMKRPVRSDESASPLSGERLYRDVEHYVRLGSHRAASAEDLQTAEWIAAALQEAGVAAATRPWKLRQFDLADHGLVVEGRPISTWPIWYPVATEPGGISAPLGVLGPDTPSGALRGRVALVDGDTLGQAVWTQGFGSIFDAAVRTGAVALLVVIRHAAGELAVPNPRPPFHQAPVPLPAIVVAGHHEAQLTTAARAGSEATLWIRGNDDPSATTLNVVGHLPRGADTVVISTPISGWFSCGSERGSGVALLLGLARWAVSHRGRCSYLFLANSAHELDNLGARQSLIEHAPPPEKVRLWINLGASIGARGWKIGEDGNREPLPEPSGLSRLGCHPDLLSTLRAAFSRTNGIRLQTRPIHGELRHVLEAGYLGCGLFGAHAFFHTSADTHSCTSSELLQPPAEALARTLHQLDPIAAGPTD